MLNQKTISVENAAASITATAPNGVTTAFIPATNEQSTLYYLRIATKNQHNFFAGSLVTVTGLKNTWLGLGSTSWLAPIIAQPILRIDDPYSFCVDIPYASIVGYFSAYTPFNGATSAADGYIYPWATAQLVNGQLDSVDIKYAQHLY